MASGSIAREHPTMCGREDSRNNTSTSTSTSTSTNQQWLSSQMFGQRCLSRPSDALLLLSDHSNADACPCSFACRCHCFGSMAHNVLFYMQSKSSSACLLFLAVFPSVFYVASRRGKL